MSVSYSADSYLPLRFVNHVRFALQATLIDHQQEDKNLLEKVGDVGLWPLENIPRVVKWINKGLQDPRLVTLALTLLSLGAVSFAFYPDKTLLFAKMAFLSVSQHLPKIPLWGLKFSAYIAIIGNIISASARAEGRFLNPALMKRFYANDLSLTNNLMHN